MERVKEWSDIFENIFFILWINLNSYCSSAFFNERWKSESSMIAFISYMQGHHIHFLLCIKCRMCRSIQGLDGTLTISCSPELLSIKLWKHCLWAYYSGHFRTSSSEQFEQNMKLNSKEIIVRWTILVLVLVRTQVIFIIIILISDHLKLQHNNNRKRNEIVSNKKYL